MNLLKNLLGRLSESFSFSVPVVLRLGTRKMDGPLLELMSNDQNPMPFAESEQKQSDFSEASYVEVLEKALCRSESWFFNKQHVDHGYWVEELEADTTLTAEYIMLRRYLGLVDSNREEKAVQYLRNTQLEEGGWPIFAGGSTDISASVKAYFALKLAGISKDERFMRRAREAILAKGGVVAANVFTKITLALFGQYDWGGIPRMPPEIILAPKRFYFNIYAVSYWSRAVIIPLLIIFSYQPRCKISPEQGIDELFLIPRELVNYRLERPFQKDRALCSWRNFFIWIDRMIRVYDRYHLVSLRKKALQKAEMWLLQHVQGEGGLGAIYPAMANSIFALHALGYQETDPLITKALKEIEALEIETPASENGLPLPTLHLQPCHSPVWDTALTLNALIELNVSLEHPSLKRAESWLRSRQTKMVGDWAISSSSVKPGGWYFQFENEWYPDVDDTAAVVTALKKLSLEYPSEQDDAIRHGSQWILSMQSSNGGWGAYDKDNDRLIFNKIPFADHQALLDPPTPDVTGRCLEMLGTLGYDHSHPAVGMAMKFLRHEQKDDGSWYGRWGVNYIYGTWSVLVGLQAIGVDMKTPWIKKAVLWLESKQNFDGGWGESCLSYADPQYSGEGKSTASQTAWALMALLAAQASDSMSVNRGVSFLLNHQREDGTWTEPYHTGTGFPRVFYLRYHGYSKYFPMWALAMYRNIRSHGRTKAEELRKTAWLARNR